MRYLAAILLLTACGRYECASYQDNGGEYYIPLEAQEVTEIMAYEPTMTAICGGVACAIMWPDELRCEIYLPVAVDQEELACLRKHELKHCEEGRWHE